MKQHGNYQLKYFTVPTYIQDGGEFRCVKYSDLPDTLANAFKRDYLETGCPAGYGCLHEFIRFMAGHDAFAKKYSGRMELDRVQNLEYRNLTVPVWKCADPELYHMYKGEFVRFEDLPEDLAKAFGEWQMSAACPGFGASYLHDFEGFMDRGGKGWSGDFSAIVKKYR
jgi:hypothetical protein